MGRGVGAMAPAVAAAHISVDFSSDDFFSDGWGAKTPAGSGAGGKKGAGTPRRALAPINRVRQQAGAQPGKQQGRGSLGGGQPQKQQPGGADAQASAGADATAPADEDASDWSWVSPTKMVTAVAEYIETVDVTPTSPTERMMVGKGSETRQGRRSRRSTSPGVIGGSFGLLGTMVNGLGNAVIRGSVNVARGIEVALNDLESAASELAGAADSPSKLGASAQASAYQKHKRWQQQQQQQRQKSQKEVARSRLAAPGCEVPASHDAEDPTEAPLRVPVAAPLARQTKSKPVKLRGALKAARSPQGMQTTPQGDASKPQTSAAAAATKAAQVAARGEAEVEKAAEASLESSDAEAVRAELEDARKEISALRAQNDDLKASLEHEREATDPLADMLRMQTEALMKERATLRRDNESLARDNDQLHELVEFLDSSLRQALAAQAHMQQAASSGDDFKVPLSAMPESPHEGEDMPPTPVANPDETVVEASDDEQCADVHGADVAEATP